MPLLHLSGFRIVLFLHVVFLLGFLFSQQTESCQCGHDNVLLLQHVWDHVVTLIIGHSLALMPTHSPK